MLTVEHCPVMEVVAKPSAGYDIDGTYTYAGRSDGRPMFRRDTSPDICLFHWQYWKVDGCGWLGRNSKGLILSNYSSHQSPNDTGLTWKYLNKMDGPPDTSIVVKCESESRPSME